MGDHKRNPNVLEHRKPQSKPVETKVETNYGFTADGRVLMRWSRPVDMLIMTPQEVDDMVRMLTECKAAMLAQKPANG